jgi:1-acyl-sn-glycerol-3-phosphate acyltransferase
MQEVVIAKPYKFVPPHHGSFWPWLLLKLLPGYLRRKYGLEHLEFCGLDRLQTSLQAGHSVLLAPNHCRPNDPFVLMQLGAELRQHVYIMASAHLFMQGGLQRWLLPRVGAFSVFREGLDREALKMATQLLAEARRPLVVFPEGVITRGNDRLGYVMDGVAFMARAAAKTRAKSDSPGQVVIHPVALRYTFEGDLRRTIEPVLDMIEQRLGWYSQASNPLGERVRRLGEALLSIKEVEYFGVAQSGSRAERLPRLIDRVLRPHEEHYLSGHREPTTVARIKKLRGAILPLLANGELGAQEQAARWRHLADCTLAQALDCYPQGYIDGEPSAEHLLETVERYEEDATDEARCHRPLHCRLEIGEPLPVAAERPRGEADHLTIELEDRLKSMLAASAHLCHPWHD